MQVFRGTASPVGEQTGRDINIWTLRFADFGLEQRYRDSKLLFLFAATRTIYPLAAGIWAIFTLLNEFAIQDPSAKLLSVRLVAIFGNIAAFVVTLATKPGRWVETGLSAMLAFNLLSLTLVLASMSSVSLPYYSPLSNAIVQVLCCYSFGVIYRRQG